MDEGLEHRFLKAAETANTREELLALVKTKRYTHARLSRLCMLSLLGVTRDFADRFGCVNYIVVCRSRHITVSFYHEGKSSCILRFFLCILRRLCSYCTYD